MTSRRRFSWCGLAMVVLIASFNTLAPTSYAVFSGTTVNPNDSYAASAAFCPTASPVWLTGFESGVASAAGATVTPAASLLNTVTGSVTADDGITRGGSYALRIAKVASANHYVAKTNLGAGTAVTMRLAIRFETLPSASQTELLKIDITSGSDVLLGYNNGTPKQFSIGYQTGTQANGPASGLQAGHWYRIDLRVNVSTNPHTVDWRVDGAPQTQATIAQAADTFAGGINLGSTVSADAFTAYYDDVLTTLSDADYPLPNGQVQALVPNSYVTENDHPSGYLKETNGTTDISATSYQLLDDTRMNSTADYVQQTNGSATDYWAEFGFEDVARTGCVNGVSAVVAVRSNGTTANSVKTAIWQGGTERVVHSADSVATTTLQYRSAVIAPATAGWNPTKVSGTTVRLGYYRAGGSVPRWDAVRLEYDQNYDAGSLYANTVLTDSPASYWRLGEDPNATAVGAAKGSITGSYTGTVRGTGGAVGDTNSAFNLDGSDDHVTFGDVYDFNATTAFSVEAWVRPTNSAATNNPAIICKVTAAAADGWCAELSIATGSNRTFESLRKQGASAAQPGGTTIVRPDKWYHVVVTYNGTTLRLYVNGVQEASAATTISLSDRSDPLMIGAVTNGDPNGHFRGSVDEVAVYTTTLSAARVLAHYNAGKP